MALQFDNAFRKLLALLTVLFLLCDPLAAETPGLAVLLDIEGPIGPATSDYFHRGLEKARARNAQLVVLRMDTPGGLDISMRDIIQDILASPIPVVSYVAPSGARAASAGTYILYASHVAAMAPGTNLGAATPIQIGGMPTAPSPTPESDEAPSVGDSREGKADPQDEQEPPPTAHPSLTDKMVNDAVAYIRSLAQMRGRNVEWAEKAVREAASLPAEEAVAAGVVDLLAEDLDSLLARVDGRTVTVLGEPRRLESLDLAVLVVEPDWRSELLAIITNPNVAYILMLVGIYGLIIEFYSPGAFYPGVTGAISLLLALYAFQVLPINYAGLALLLLGVGLMVAETFVPSIGALGIGGTAAFVIGSVMLLDTDAPGYGISPLLIGSIALVSAAVFLLAITLLMRSRRRPVVSGVEEMIGAEGRVIDWDGQDGRVRVHGETWRASASDPLEPGQSVRIAEVEGLNLNVEPLGERSQST